MKHRLREDVFEHAFRLIYDDTIHVRRTKLTGYDINPDIRSGPLYIFVEDPQSITPEWNVLSNPIGDTTTSWTVSNTAATIVSQI